MKINHSTRRSAARSAANASIALAALLALGACGAPGANNVKTATLARGAISQTIEATGNIQASNEARVSFQQNGILNKLNVVLGDTVKKGDVLAELDRTDLELAQRQSEAQLAQSRNNVRNAEQAIIVAQSNYSRTIEGTRKGDLDAAQAALNSAWANYNRVVKGTGSDVAAAQAAYDAANANQAKVYAGPTAADLASVKAAMDSAEVTVKNAQFAYDNAFRRNPAGIGASPQAADLERATINFNAAKANYDKAFAGYDDAAKRSADQAVANARASLDRLGGVTDASNKAAAYQQVQSAQANLDKLKEPARNFDVAQVQAQLEQARIALDNARAAVELNEVALAQARRRVDQATLRAPFDGVIGSVNVKEGESMNTQATALVLADPGRFHMDVTVDELDITGLKQGQDVKVSVDALSGMDVAGKVERISSTSTKINGVVNYTVRVSLANTAALKSGMSGTARIVLASKADALLAPVGAITRDASGRSTVKVRNGNDAAQIEVATGLRNSTYVEIVSGVEAGREVVLR